MSSERRVSWFEQLAFHLKLWASLLALLTALAGVAWAGGGWVMDRQSKALAEIQHDAMLTKLRAEQEESEKRHATTIEDIKELLLRQHIELRADIKDVHKRIDSLIKQ